MLPLGGGDDLEPPVPACRWSSQACSEALLGLHERKASTVLLLEELENQFACTSSYVSQQALQEGRLPVVAATKHMGQPTTEMQQAQVYCLQAGVWCSHSLP